MSNCPWMFLKSSSANCRYHSDMYYYRDKERNRRITVLITQLPPNQQGFKDVKLKHWDIYFRQSHEI
ncbi:hypothetical protein VNO77_29084 [Canavalia gladiata]|uniref:Uncharacterized protein n=1 Tax=Canavalia gladiata TaxID=3824 RepID=A0AAN9L112_CANGL